MKELISDSQLYQKENIEINVKKQQQAEYTLIASTILKPGMTLFEFDYDKMEIRIANIKKQNAVNFETKQATGNKKVVLNPKVYYFQSHCLKAAVKKINKIIKNTSGYDDYFSVKNKQAVANY